MGLDVASVVASGGFLFQEDPGAAHPTRLEELLVVQELSELLPAGILQGHEQDQRSVFL